MIPVQKIKLYDEAGEDLESLPGPIHLQETQKPQPITKTSVQGRSTSMNIKRLCGSLYHKDGNVVLVVADVGLRVHASVLEGNTGFFRDLFAAACPPRPEETFDGCPIIPVYDGMEGLTLFLGVMYGYTYVLSFPSGLFKLPTSGCRPILNISVNSDEFWTLLKIATKYAAFGIRRSCIKMLSQAGYAVTLKDYDSSTTRPGLSSGCLNALQETNVRVLLPVTYYFLCQQTDAFIEECELDNDALMRLYRGGCKLAKVWPEFVAKEIVKRAQDRETCCRPIFKQAFDSVSNLILDANLNGFVAPLLYLLRHQADMSFERGLCERCKEDFQDAMFEERERVWTSLPRVFGITNTWEELEVRVS
ncbi:hypothetical protein M422DRAFT_53271 [Sphaerobolus stellatus SS14]|uniref:Unplaced genomic scaffold SPHSTscaffold_163, whole genome shotgun sequence n=1 Tax=Sphaerobolus stellatus (strain SS14) TaxID=990650 RepID=A0A0C9TNS3_SPHS4|nr:hypothetical protein M422DRAFT_53271 [Sphaerobolus stellatus SS14]